MPSTVANANKQLKTVQSTRYASRLNEFKSVEEALNSDNAKKVCVYQMSNFICMKFRLKVSHFFFPLEGVFLPPFAVDALFRLLLGDGDLSLSLAASAACASSFCFSASRNFCL